MHPYRLPLKFVLLWLANLAVLLAISFATGFHTFLLTHIHQLRTVTGIYLAAGAILAALEQELWDKLRGN